MNKITQKLESNYKSNEDNLLASLNNLAFLKNSVQSVSISVTQTQDQVLNNTFLPANVVITFKSEAQFSKDNPSLSDNFVFDNTHKTLTNNSLLTKY